MLNVCFTGNKIWSQSKIIAILKPWKDSAILKNYIPISLLCHTYKHIEDGCQRGMINLSAAYDTVNHIILIQKLSNITKDSPLCRVIQNMLFSRRFYLELNSEHSRWRKQKNGLPQGSALSPIPFIICTNDQPLHNGTRSFQYTDDICVTAQQSSFIEVETTIEETHTILHIQQSACKPRHTPSYGVSPEEQRGEENVKGEMEPDISGDHTPS